MNSIYSLIVIATLWILIFSEGSDSDQACTWTRAVKMLTIVEKRDAVAIFFQLLALSFCTVRPTEPFDSAKSWPGLASGQTHTHTHNYISTPTHTHTDWPILQPCLVQFALCKQISINLNFLGTFIPNPENKLMHVSENTRRSD